MNSSPNCNETFTKTECEFDDVCEDNLWPKHSNETSTITSPSSNERTNIPDSVLKTESNNSSNEMKMPSSTLESISLLDSEPNKNNNEIIADDDQSTNQNGSKAQNEVMKLVSEMTDIVESRHEDSLQKAQHKHDNNQQIENDDSSSLSPSSDNDYLDDCGTLLYNKNSSNKQPQHSTENGFNHSENVSKATKPQNLKLIQLPDIQPGDDYDYKGMSLDHLERFAETFLNPNYKLGNNNNDDDDDEPSVEQQERQQQQLDLATMFNKPLNNLASAINTQSGTTATTNGTSTINDPTMMPYGEEFVKEGDSVFNNNSPGKTLDDTFDALGAENDACIVGQIFQKDAPVAVLVSKNGSCSFVDRKIKIFSPIKIGRAVARLKPAPNNAVFDCKVLSRNHALLLYQNGKFYLRDAGSSNGTFINNVRLSNTGKRSRPHQIYSGDLLQFGVEVTEKKQIHNCVIAEIKLYQPNGTEARKPCPEQQNFDEYGNPDSLQSGFVLSTSQMMELSHFIKESMHKQSLLENQLESIKNLMEQARDSASQKWHSLIKEDLLMSRIEVLQDKLIALTMTKNVQEPQFGDFSLEDISNEVNGAITEKQQFELKTKAVLQKLIEEKTLISQNLSSLEKALQLKELECDDLKSMFDQGYRDLQQNIIAFENVSEENSQLKNKIKSFEKMVSDYKEKETQNELAKQELETKLSTVLEQNKENVNESLPLMLTAQTQTQSCNHSSQINGDIAPSDKDLEAIVSLSNILKSLQQLNSNFNENNTLKIFESLSSEQRLVCVEKRFAELRNIVNTQRKKDQESYETLLKELENYVQQNRQLTKDSTELRLQIDQLNQEIEKYKIDLQALQSQKNDNMDDNKEDKCSTEQEPSEQQDLVSTFSDNDREKLNELLALWPKLEIVLDKSDSSKDSLDSASKPDVIQQLKTVIENNRDLAHENQSLVQDVDLLRTKIRELSDKNELSFLFAAIPLLVFIIALVLGFYPFLSSIMATSGV